MGAYVLVLVLVLGYDSDVLLGFYGSPMSVSVPFFAISFIDGCFSNFGSAIPPVAGLFPYAGLVVSTGLLVYVVAGLLLVSSVLGLSAVVAGVWLVSDGLLAGLNKLLPIVVDVYLGTDCLNISLLPLVPVIVAALNILSALVVAVAADVADVAVVIGVVGLLLFLNISKVALSAGLNGVVTAFYFPIPRFPSPLLRLKGYDYLMSVVMDGFFGLSSNLAYCTVNNYFFYFYFYFS